MLITEVFRLQNTRHSSSGPFPEYRFKEKVFLRKSDLNEIEDTAGKTNSWSTSFRRGKGLETRLIVGRNVVRKTIGFITTLMY